ncbi:MAG: TRAP transporter small permease [Inquilinaceae bacterium]
MAWLARLLDWVLQIVTLGLLVTLAVIVVVAVAFRYSGNSLIWYDEAASLLLAWITFIGAGLAALRNAHLSFGGLLTAAPPALQAILFVIGDIVFHAAFWAMAWAGWTILAIFGTESLVSLPWISLAMSKAVLPVAAVVISLARALTTAERWRQMRAGKDAESLEIEAEIARAQRDLETSSTGPSR